MSAASKKKSARLGYVNVNAIEDYKELLERHTFLTTQYDGSCQSRGNAGKYHPGTG